MRRDLLQRGLKQWRRVRNFFYLCWAPFGVLPSSFRTEAGQRSPYKDLGWSVPLTPGLIYGFAIEPVMRTMVFDRLNFGPEGNLAADLMRELADWLPHAAAVIVFFIIVYVGAFLLWLFHGVMCRYFQNKGQTARNAPFEFYLVRFAGVSTLFALTMVVMLIPAFAQYDKGWRRDVAISIAGYPLLMPGLFLGLSALWFVAILPGLRMKQMNEVYSSEKQKKIVRRVQMGISLAVVLVGFAWLILQVRTITPANQGHHARTIASLRSSASLPNRQKRCGKSSAPTTRTDGAPFNTVAPALNLRTDS